MLKRLFLSLLVALIPTQGFGQASVLQGGSFTPGQLPVYSSSGGSQPVIQQSGPASGTGVGIREFAVTARGTGAPPYVGQGSGYLGSIGCFYDAPITNAAGYHQLCFSPNATGGFGLLSFNAFGGASAIPLKLNVNGTTVEFPFSTSGVVGPATSVVGHVATWNNTSGTLLADGGVLPTVGGTPNQIQYNAAGSFGGFTVSGDCTVVVATGVWTCTKINNVAVNLGGTLTTAAAFTQSGAFATTLTSTGATNVTLPTTGTLATLAGSEAFTNKTYNGLTITATTGTLTLTNGKTLTIPNTLQFSGTDGSTLNIGTGGTLGTAAYTASSTYMPSGVQITNSLSGNIALNNTSNYFDGPSVAQGSSGTWYASGTVTATDSGGAANIYCKLWDGTTLAASTAVNVPGAGSFVTLSLSGYIASPAGNIRISCRDVSATTGIILFNQTGNSKDATITAFRVQ